jgi:hypothetical protein
VRVCVIASGAPLPSASMTWMSVASPRDQLKAKRLPSGRQQNHSITPSGADTGRVIVPRSRSYTQSDHVRPRER